MHPEVDPDVAWVERLSGASREASEAAVQEAASARRLYTHLEREHRSEGRSSYIEIDAPLELHALVRLRRPRHVVEVGVSSGVSSAYLLHAMSLNQRGTLHSVDLPKKPAKRAPGRPGAGASWSIPPGRSSGWAVPMPLRSRWDLRLGDKRIVVPLLAEELPLVDLVVYDVPHQESDARREFRTLQSTLTAGGAVIADHGIGGGLCSGLRVWAREVGATPSRRTGSGLYGFQSPEGGGPAPSGARSR